MNCYCWNLEPACGWVRFHDLRHTFATMALEAKKEHIDQSGFQPYKRKKNLFMGLYY